MKPCRLAAALVVFAGWINAQAPTAAELLDKARSGVTVRVDVGRERRFVGEAAVVRIEVRYDRLLLAAHAAPLFQRQLDVPLQVVVPWFDGGDLAASLPDLAAGVGKRTRIVVNERVVDAEQLADVEVGGRVFAALAITSRLAPRRAGRIELSPPRVRFALATEFLDDFVNGRVAVDRVDAEVQGEPSAWTVEEPPRLGRPASFCGAVGRIVVAADTGASEIGADGRIEVALVVRGDCDLASWSLPKLAIPGFHVLGALDRSGKEERAFALDLELIDVDVVAVPPIELASFDPETASFVVAASAPIPFRLVAPLLRRNPIGSVPLVDAVHAGLRIEDFDVPASRALPPDVTRISDGVVLIALAMPFFVMALVMAFRRRSKAKPAPDHPRSAAAAFEAAVARGDADLLVPFDCWLAARAALQRLPAADADVEAALAHAGFAGSIATRAIALRRSLLASRYKGMSAAARVAAQHFVEEAERAFDAGGMHGDLR